MKQPSRKGNKKTVRRQNLRIVHRHAAGIDVGSRRHYVAIPASCEGPTIRHFGPLTPELHEMGTWLKDHGIETVVMESTGVYWIPVAQVLDGYGIAVHLVDARLAKNVPGRKSDVQDCQWLQELHTFGLLRSAFRPSNALVVLRSYWRHRKDLVQAAGQQIQRMQKSLELMNLQLHKVLSDITGVTGMKIIRAIVAGERSPAVLAGMRHGTVKCSEATIAKALTGDWRQEHLFTLEQALQAYDFYHGQIVACDERIEAYLKTFPSQPSETELDERPDRSRRKNEVHFDLRRELHRITGVDLTRIDGIDVLTAQTLISECGYDMSRFANEKAFSSWLGLSPNHRITGGKVQRRGTRKVNNRAAEALRMAAQSLHRSRTALGAFYRRQKGRLGPPKAITATAHKLAVLVYRMLRYGMNYVDQGQEAYERQYQQTLLRTLKKRARQMGYQIVALQSGEIVS